MGISNWNAGIIRPVPVDPTGPYENNRAPGVWTRDQVAYWQKQGLWPTAGRTPGQTVFLGNVYNTTASQNTYSWVVPTDVTSINAVCIGSGGSGSQSDSSSQSARAGDLRYINSLAVTPGETLTILCGNAVTDKVSAGSGSATEIRRGATVLLSAAGGNGISGIAGTSSTIGGNIGGGNGGNGGTQSTTYAGGGGGTGGYSGNGGSGENFDTTYTAPTADSGAAAGGARSTAKANGGGGVNLIKKGTTAAGAQSTAGSNGNDGYPTATYGTGFYGAGGGGNDGGSANGGQGAPGACRIIWGGVRTFPDASDDYIPLKTTSYSEIQINIRIPAIATDGPIDSINLFQVVVTDENDVNFMTGLTAVDGSPTVSFSSITTGQFTLKSKDAIGQTSVARFNNGLYTENVNISQINVATPMSLFIKPATAKRIKQIKLYTENRSIWSFVNWMEVYGDGNLLTYGQVIPIWSTETTVGGTLRVPTITFT